MYHMYIENPVYLIVNKALTIIKEEYISMVDILELFKVENIPHVSAIDFNIVKKGFTTVQLPNIDNTMLFLSKELYKPIVEGIDSDGTISNGHELFDNKIVVYVSVDQDPAEVAYIFMHELLHSLDLNSDNILTEFWKTLNPLDIVLFYISPEENSKKIYYKKKYINWLLTQRQKGKL